MIIFIICMVLISIIFIRTWWISKKLKRVMDRIVDFMDEFVAVKVSAEPQKYWYKNEAGILVHVEKAVTELADVYLVLRWKEVYRFALIQAVSFNPLYIRDFLSDNQKYSKEFIEWIIPMVRFLNGSDGLFNAEGKVL